MSRSPGSQFSERAAPAALAEPWNVPVRSFFTYDLGRWRDGPLPPVSRSYGVDVPMNPKTQGSSGPGRT